MEECIFCKIVAGELPSEKICEDKKVLAFLDIAPVNIGHTLVVPKEHFVNIYDTPDETLASMTRAVKRISRALKSNLGADGVTVSMSNDAAGGQVIFHAHMHVIPRYEADGFLPWRGNRPYKDGEMKEVAGKLSAGL